MHSLAFFSLVVLFFLDLLSFEALFASWQIADMAYLMMSISFSKLWMHAVKIFIGWNDLYQRIFPENHFYIFHTKIEFFDVIFKFPVITIIEAVQEQKTRSIIVFHSFEIVSAGG